MLIASSNDTPVGCTAAHLVFIVSENAVIVGGAFGRRIEMPNGWVSAECDCVTRNEKVGIEGVEGVEGASVHVVRNITK